MKKTLKIFLTSFALSSFAIWTADELFLSVSSNQNQPIEIPQKNIALFFQNQSQNFPALAVKGVKEEKLATIIPVVSKEDSDINVNDYASLFALPNNAPAVNISSVEDVADIPLEYGAPKKIKKNEKKEDIAKAILPVKKTIAEQVEKHSDLINFKSDFSNAVRENTPEKADNISKKEEIKLAQVSLPAANLEIDTQSQTNIESDSDIIPIENGQAQKEEKVEIVNNAPMSQVAMAGPQITVDTLAIEQKEAEEQPQKREWHAMPAVNNDSPWVVAKGNQYAKNSKIVEDFADISTDAEIENLLAPKKMEEEGKEVQTAEMVKNILIPIPEDILNDKNLTPQLVSPKKSEIETYAESDVDENEDKDEGSTLLKSITSIFSSSSDSKDSDVADEDAGESKSRRKKGLFAAFSEDKAATKILPAEMKLAFQPGRAEISGQTLRWIQAFANKAAEDPDVILEIRIDKNSSYALQQRRLDLLHTILNSKGIDGEKVNTVFTSREPNSFIIRTLRLSDNSHSRPVKINQRKSANYQTW